MKFVLNKQTLFITLLISSDFFQVQLDLSLNPEKSKQILEKCRILL